MSDMSLPYFVGTVDKLQSCGIGTAGLRKSLTGEITESIVDGETVITDTHLAIVHQSILTPDQIRAVRFEAEIDWYFGDEAVALMSTPARSAEEAL